MKQHMDNNHYRFSVSPVWAERIENGAALLQLIIFCGCLFSLTVLFSHHVVRAMGWV